MREQRDVLQSLLKSPGWEVVRETAERWIKDNTEKASTQPVFSTEDAYQRNFDIGQTHGVRTLLKLPKTQVEMLDKAIKRTIEDETDDEYRSEDD